MSHAFGQAARIYENQRGGMLIRKLGEAIVDFAPHFVRWPRAKLARRHFDRQIYLAAMGRFAPMAGIALSEPSGNARWFQSAFAWRKRPMRGEALAGELIQPFERKRQMCARLSSATA